MITRSLHHVSLFGAAFQFTLVRSSPFMKFLLPLLLCFFTTLVRGAERPDIILIMVDDMGFSDLGYHGGEIDTPNIDALAKGGVRFSQFYNSGRCCPTRATLMTGLHPHQTGIGWMTQPPGKLNGKGKPEAYQGYLNRECVTVAEVLKPAGYATSISGKWHLGYNDRDRWPLQRGFENFYGAISGATRFFHPFEDRGITFGNEPVRVPESTTDEAFYTTDAFTDYAIRFLKDEAEGEGRPSFLYLAYTAPHWPLHAFEDDIAKYRGKYRAGWDALRTARHQKQIELGLIDADWPISPRTPEIPDWESLDEKKQDEMDLKMAIYAAMIDRVDQNIGRLVSFLKAQGTYDDTLIMFLSDNGACQEGGMLGRGEFYDIEKRNLETSNSYGEAWANAGSTPFRLYKHFAHEGGTATPFFMHWPAGIEAREEWLTDPAQLIDIMPTILDVADADYPEKAHGNDIPSLDGISLRPAFTGDGLSREEPIFIEHENNASVRDGDWKLVGRGVAADKGVAPDKWELYNMAEDRAETKNLAAANPVKLKELAGKWLAWAERVDVYPKVKPGAAGPKAEENPPQVVGREYSVTTTVRGPDLNGVVLAHGGVRFGYSLYFDQGKPAFAFRNEGKLVELKGTKALSGKVDLSVEVKADEIVLSANGQEVAKAANAGLMKEQPGLGLYLEQDFRDPVGSYKVPNRLSGKLVKQRIQVRIPKVEMQTKWAADVTPETVWSVYPRPNFRRENWTNLNGEWDYAVTAKSVKKAPSEWEGKILVPFAIESPLSGVEQRFSPDDALWYQRSFEGQVIEGERTILNFEAVDYETTVWVNGTEIGGNVGGNLPFSLDATSAIKEGENELLLRVTDATDSAYQLHGKQRLNPKGIFYTPVSGIWQTVWMEQVPDLHLTNVKIETRMNGEITLTPRFSQKTFTATPSIEYTVMLDGEVIVSQTGSTDPITITIPEPQLWSPDSPTLYDLEIRGLGEVKSYFGIRETGIEKGDDGHLRFTLNGKPIFHWGTLDQGWWPDGLLTPPSEAAMVSDIEYLKAAGFNTIRKHIKVEPRVYYYHCDKLGMMLWQDQVSSMADSPEWTRLKPDPETRVWPEEAHAQYLREHKQMIDGLYNHPSIVQWVPFNERWGQHRTVEVGEWVTAYDPSRAINIASGGNFFPSGHIVDEHRYPHPGFPFELDIDGRFDPFVKVVGEFGGHGFPVDGHLWDPNTRNWGYGGLPKDKAEWLERYRTSIEKLAELKQQGIAAGIYTQTTDVEGEINGLITYDREVQKISPEQLAEIATLLE